MPSQADTAAIEAKYAMLTDPGIRRFLAETEMFYPPDATDHTVVDQRALYDRLCAHFRSERPAGLDVRDELVEGSGGAVPVRLYRPRVAGDLPVMLYFHGGGFILGSLDSHDGICAEIAAGAGIAVISVDYRLAPEHPFPAAFDDVVAVARWASAGGAGEGFDPGHLIAGGDSAGGNLSAALALKARDDGGPAIRGLVLVNPALGGDLSRGSCVERAEGPGLTTADMRYYEHTYVGPEDHPAHASKFAYPLKETDYADLPPAFIVACEWDPLRDDCYDWQTRVAAAGGAAKVRREPLLVHAFLRARHMSEPARVAFAAIVDEARSLAFSGQLL